MYHLPVERLRLDMFHYADREDQVDLSAEAQALFQRATLKGKLRTIWAKLTGRSAHLLDLASVKSSRAVTARHDQGTQSIAISQIRGSEGRAQDFDSHFNPLQEHTQQRWMNIAKAWLTDVTLPPVEVVQVHDLYFVRDGHHRVSVARAMGQTFIDAKVTRWDVYDPKPRIIAPVFCQCACPAA